MPPANTGSTGAGALDKILSAAAKIQAIAGIVAPGVPMVGMGVEIAKFIATQINKERQAVDQIVLPSDAELIQRLADTSNRVVNTGTAFLE